jgi:hypothetical protein
MLILTELERAADDPEQTLGDSADGPLLNVSFRQFLGNTRRNLSDNFTKFDLRQFCALLTDCFFCISLAGMIPALNAAYCCLVSLGKNHDKNKKYLSGLTGCNAVTDGG